LRVSFKHQGQRPPAAWGLCTGDRAGRRAVGTDRRPKRQCRPWRHVPANRCPQNCGDRRGRMARQRPPARPGARPAATRRPAVSGRIDRPEGYSCNRHAEGRDPASRLRDGETARAASNRGKATTLMPMPATSACYWLATGVRTLRIPRGGVRASLSPQGLYGGHILSSARWWVNRPPSDLRKGCP
jgi:hypothetical protein